MIGIGVHIVLLALLLFIAYIIYKIYKLPSRIKNIFCNTEIKETAKNSGTFIFLFNFSNNSFANIEKVDIIIALDSSSIIQNYKFYNRNIILNSIANNEIYLTLQNFNRFEKKVVKIIVANNERHSFQLISNTTGIKINNFVSKNIIRKINKIWKSVKFPFKKTNDPLLNAITIKEEKKKKDVIKIVTFIILILTFCCTILLNHKNLKKEIMEICTGENSSDSLKQKNEFQILNNCIQDSTVNDSVIFTKVDK